MVHNLSSSGFTSSPTAAMLSFNTPGGLEGHTPAGLNMSTPRVGGVGMMPTLSDLGLYPSGGRRNEDDERRAKMRKVLQTIGRPKGRVSEEGIARLARRVGFQSDIDAEKLTLEEKERRVGNRPFSTAGAHIAIDLNLRTHVPQSVSVEFGTEVPALTDQQSRAAEVLWEDLQVPDGLPLEARLDRFAINLERLARLDRLSVGGVNCFEAITGIYSSLRRLYEHEVQKLKASNPDGTSSNADDIAAEVACQKSGKPVMHERGKIGLEIQYWHQGRRTGWKDGSSNADIFALRIEAEPSLVGLYPSLRVSDAWLPESLEGSDFDPMDTIPWQDPAPTFLAASEGASTMAVDGQPKLPDLRFTAKLDPPLVLPYQVALNVLSSLGASPPEILVIPAQYPALLLDATRDGQPPPSALGFTTTAEHVFLSQRDGVESTVTHEYTLHSAKPDYGLKLYELPFSHPRQLIELLPTLRQWASLGSLIAATFTASKHSKTDARKTNGLTLQDLLADLETASGRDKVPINIALSTLLLPTLNITFPTIDGGRVGSVNVQVLPNSEIAVTNHDAVMLANNSDSQEQAQKLAKALDVCGDLGVWIEWMRTRG